MKLWNVELPNIWVKLWHASTNSWVASGLVPAQLSYSSTAFIFICSDSHLQYVCGERAKSAFRAVKMTNFVKCLYINVSMFFSRATLYVGKYSTSLYASPSLVHDGVTVVVSNRNKEKRWSFITIVQGWSLLCIRSLLCCSFHHLSFHATNSECCFVQACSGWRLLASLIVCVCVHTQPRGSTFPMLEGPDSQETEEDKECVITPSTSVKFNAALRERNRVNFMRNYLLLIGSTCFWSQNFQWLLCQHCPLLALMNQSSKSSLIVVYFTRLICHFQVTMRRLPRLIPRSWRSSLTISLVFKATSSHLQQTSRPKRCATYELFVFSYHKVCTDILSLVMM